MKGPVRNQIFGNILITLYKEIWLILGHMALWGRWCWRAWAFQLVPQTLVSNWNPLACQCQAVGFWKGGGAMLCAVRKRRRRDSGFRVESISPALNWTCLWKDYDYGFRVESISPTLNWTCLWKDLDSDRNPSVLHWTCLWRDSALQIHRSKRWRQGRSACRGFCTTLLLV